MILSAVIYYVSTGVNNLYILTWIAPIPLLVYALKISSVYIAGLAGFLVYFVGFSNGIVAYSSTIIPSSILVFGNLLNAIGLMLLLMVFRYMAKKKSALDMEFCVCQWLGSL